MKVNVEASGQATVEFESLEELNTEYRQNLSAGGLSLTTTVELPEFTPLQLILRLTEGSEVTVPAIVVRRFPGMLAVAIEGNAEEIFTQLSTPPVVKGIAISETAPANAESKEEEKPDQNVWDRLRNMTRTEKLMLATKADRSERAVLAQDNDAQVLFYLLKNPRIGTEEVVRIARSPLLAASTADLIAKTTQWSTSPEIRCALVSNPRTPTPLALKLLPTLPENELRSIAKGNAFNQALKQAALRLVISRNK
jgi:hypothetical protein